MTSLALVGLPGSGKSTVGRLLARRLQVEFTDVDSAIEQHVGCSVREFWQREGQECFRDIEQQLLTSLTARDQGVLATGGGAVLRAANRANLHQRCRVIYLRANPEDVFRRLRRDKTRPLLQVPDPLAALREMVALRDPLYRETAHFVIETGRPALGGLVSLVISQLELAGALELRSAKPPPDTP